jgi:hypothetical protein
MKRAIIPKNLDDVDFLENFKTCLCRREIVLEATRGCPDSGGNFVTSTF